LNLVTSAKAKQFRVAKHSYGFAVGSANDEFTADTWVFDDLLQKVAPELQINTALVLGNIMAHEIGHLLLGANLQTNGGLMRARWTREELVAADCVELVFSMLEGNEIRSAVMARRQVELSIEARRATGGTNSAAKNVAPVEPAAR
jgi:hypothetical protein